MMFHSSSSSSAISATFLGLLSASAGILPLAAALTTDDLYGKLTSTTAPAPGFNVEGGSVFTNYADTHNNEQFFILRSGTYNHERPASEPVRASFLNWCSDLTFSDFNNNISLIGYAGRCVGMFLAGYDAAVASGAQLPIVFSKGKFAGTLGISAVFVEQQNVFQGQIHADTDDWVVRYWDDGRKTTTVISWEGHDEGDMSSNAATGSFSAFGDFTWISVDEVAQLFNTSIDEFTPGKFKQIYFDTWIKDHEEEADEKNPNPGPELEIIEQVKNETNYVDDTTITPTQPDSSAAEDGASDLANNPVEDDSGSGRQLMSVAARFVSAALLVFGI